MRVHSKLDTHLAYGATVIKPGINDIDDAAAVGLQQDPHFNQHVQAGVMSILPPEEPPPAPAAIEPEPGALAVDPRAQLPGETKKAYAARLKVLDDAEAAAAVDAAFLTGFFAASEADQGVMYDAATDHERAIIDAARKSAGGV